MKGNKAKIENLDSEQGLNDRLESESETVTNFEHGGLSQQEFIELRKLLTED